MDETRDNGAIYTDDQGRLGHQVSAPHAASYLKLVVRAAGFLEQMNVMLKAEPGQNAGSDFYMVHSEPSLTEFEVINEKHALRKAELYCQSPSCEQASNRPFNKTSHLQQLNQGTNLAVVSNRQWTVLVEVPVGTAFYRLQMQ